MLAVLLATHPLLNEMPFLPDGFNQAITVAGNGEPIAYPTPGVTQPVRVGSRIVQIPAGMVYIPAGPFTMGAGASAKVVDLPAYAIGKFDVTNAEYQAFVDATGHPCPRYWHGGKFPPAKANHPVAFVSLDDAELYASWISKATGWKLAIPSAVQWEKAARGPKGGHYPWGDRSEVSYSNGSLSARFNFNALTAVDFLTHHGSEAATYDNPRSTMYGKTALVSQIASYDRGEPETLSVGPGGQVRGWVGHSTYTGFIYTDLFTQIKRAGGNTSPVGAYEAGKSGYGAYDMAGNLWNWTTTPIVATNGAERGKTVNEIRGGSWYATSRSCQSISLGEGRAARGAYNTVGFRLVALPPFAAGLSDGG